MEVDLQAGAATREREGDIRIFDQDLVPRRGNAHQCVEISAEKRHMTGRWLARRAHRAGVRERVRPAIAVVHQHGAVRRIVVHFQLRPVVRIDSNSRSLIPLEALSRTDR
jgi:hypothetical protein